MSPLHHPGLKRRCRTYRHDYRWYYARPVLAARLGPPLLAFVDALLPVPLSLLRRRWPRQRPKGNHLHSPSCSHLVTLLFCVDMFSFMLPSYSYTNKQPKPVVVAVVVVIVGVALAAAPAAAASSR